MKATPDHTEAMSASLQKSGLPQTQSVAIVVAIADSIDRYALTSERFEQKLEERLEQRFQEERVFYKPKFDRIDADIAELKTDVAELKTRCTIIEHDVRAIKETLLDHSQQLKELLEEIQRGQRRSFQQFLATLGAIFGGMAVMGTMLSA